MTLRDMHNQLTTMGEQIRTSAAALAEHSQDNEYPMDQLENDQRVLNELRARYNSMQAAYNAQFGADQASVIGQTAQQAAQTSSQASQTDHVRGSREYARAFAFAMANGLNPRNGRRHEEIGILYDALTEGTNADGGFLVPEDMDFQIRELRRQLEPLSGLFNEESVTAPTGWRIMDTTPTSGFTLVSEMGTLPTNQQPAFSRVTFTTSKYGLIVPVSRELAEDNVSNLMSYLARWFAKKSVLQENALLVAGMTSLTATTLTGSANWIKGIKNALNVTLDPAISLSSVFICNQTCFQLLDELEDDNGRGLLQPDPTNATLRRLFGRPVHVVSDSVLTSNDLFVGDGHEYQTLFRRKGLEVESTDIGGNAFRTDSIEVRGLIRLGVTRFDTAAMTRLTLAAGGGA